MIYTSVLLPVAIASYYAVAGVRHMALTQLAIAIFLVELLMKCIKINNQVPANSKVLFIKCSLLKKLKLIKERICGLGNFCVSFYWCIYHFQSHNKKRS